MNIVLCYLTIGTAFTTAFLGLIIASIFGFAISWFFREMQVNQLNSKLKALKSDMKSKVAKSLDLEGDIDKLKLLLSEESNNADKQQSKAKQYKKMRKNLQNAKVDLESNLTDALEERLALEEKLNSKNNDFIMQSSKNEQLEKELADMQHMFNSANEQLKQQKSKADLVPDLNNKIETMSKDLKKFKDNLLAKEIITDDLSKKLKKSKSDLSDLKLMINDQNANSMNLNSWLVENEQ